MDSKLNQLQTLLPAGVLVDAAWLKDRGYYSSLVAKYVRSGWLEQPTRGAYRRAGKVAGQADDAWASVILSLQRLRPPLPLLGGRTALELLGFSHYLTPSGPQELHLYGRDPPPIWTQRMLGERLKFHRAKLFTDDPVLGPTQRLDRDSDHIRRPDRDGIVGQLSTSTAERAFLELLEEVPQAASFHEADTLVAALSTLSPRRMSHLLTSCRSVKTKRLALWFSDRHRLPWAERLDRQDIDLGQGNRVLAPGGRLDPTYRITVPREMAGS